MSLVPFFFESFLHPIRKGLVFFEHRRTGQDAPRAHCYEMYDDEEIDKYLERGVDIPEEI